MVCFNSFFKMAVIRLDIWSKKKQIKLKWHEWGYQWIWILRIWLFVANLKYFSSKMVPSLNIRENQFQKSEKTFYKYET